MKIAVVLGLLLLGIILFSLEIFSVDIVTVLLLLGLVLSGVLSPDEAFAGFSSDIIIILASMFIISGALQRTGAVDALARQLIRFSGKSMHRLLFLMMSVTGITSAFMNNTTVTALFVAPVLTMAKKLRVSPSKLLMPLAYASMLGGACTLIGTSTNIAVNAYLKTVGLRPIGLFEVTPLGAVLLFAGILYIGMIGYRLLPDRPEEGLAKDYSIREYLSEIIVLKGSKMIGKTIYESDLGLLNFHVLEILRGDARFFPNERTLIQPNDVLLVKGNAEDLLKVKKTTGIEIRPELHSGEPILQDPKMKIAEVLVNPRSLLIGRTLKELEFRAHYGVTVLALFRHARSLVEQISNVRLRLGDLLLVQGTQERLQALRHSPEMSILEEVNPGLYRGKKAGLALLFFLWAMIVSGAGWMPLSVAFLSAAVLTVLFRCIELEQAYTMIDWRLLIMIGGMTAFGLAMDKTGAADFLAKEVVHHFKVLGPHGMLFAYFMLTLVLTQPMSNAAAALVVLPVALNTAEEMHLNPRTFAITVMFAASVSFITPLEPSCILVYGPGKYRFQDFVRNGIGLTVLLAILILFLVPRLWPL